MLICVVHQNNSVICAYIYIYTHTHTHTHTLFFQNSLPLWFSTGHWIEVSVLYSGTLLFIHSVYNSWHLLTPNSQSIPPLTPSHLATTSLFFMFVSLFLFHGYVDLYHILFIYWIQHISDIVWYVSFSFWLTSLGVVFSRSIHAASNCLILLDVWIIFHG